MLEPQLASESQALWVVGSLSGSLSYVQRMEGANGGHERSSPTPGRQRGKENRRAMNTHSDPIADNMHERRQHQI